MQEDSDDPSQTRNHAIYICLGCRSVTYAVEDFDNYYVNEEHYQPHRSLYPNTLARRLPDWLSRLPKPLPSLFEETYIAFSLDCYALTAMGVRAIVDRLLTDKLGDIGGFERKLTSAAEPENGLLTPNQCKVLQAIIELGSASSHRGHTPGAKTIENTLVILENLVESIFVIPDLSDDVRKETPPRQNK